MFNCMLYIYYIDHDYYLCLFYLSFLYCHNYYTGSVSHGSTEVRHSSSFSGMFSLGDTALAQKTDFDMGKIYFWVTGCVAQCPPLFIIPRPASPPDLIILFTSE